MARKRTKAQRQQRRQEIKQNVLAFIDRHDDKIVPIVKAVLAKRFPGAAMIIEAIKEAKASKLPADTKEVTVEHLTELLALAESDDNPDEPARLLNSTLVSRYVTPFNLWCSCLAFYGALLTEIAVTWGLISVNIDNTVFMVITSVYCSLHGLNIWSRTELKKNILQNDTE